MAANAESHFSLVSSFGIQIRLLCSITQLDNIIVNSLFFHRVHVKPDGNWPLYCYYYIQYIVVRSIGLCCMQQNFSGIHQTANFSTIIINQYVSISVPNSIHALTIGTAGDLQFIRIFHYIRIYNKGVLQYLYVLLWRSSTVVQLSPGLDGHVIGFNAFRQPIQ